jgi:hypothetical protein
VVPLLAQASANQACPLLTAAEVNAAVGITSRPGKPFLSSKMVCYFSADTGYNSSVPSVTLMVMNPMAFQNQSHIGGPSNTHPLSGLGDEAYAVGRESYAKVLVRKGARALSVTVTLGESRKATWEQLVAMEETLARQAVARL